MRATYLRTDVHTQPRLQRHRSIWHLHLFSTSSLREVSFCVDSPNPVSRASPLMESNVSINFLRAITLQLPGPWSRFFSDRPQDSGTVRSSPTARSLETFSISKTFFNSPLPPFQPSNCERLVIALRKLVKFLREFCRSKLGGISITIWKLQILGGEFVISDRISILFGEGEAVAITGGTLANVQF